MTIAGSTLQKLRHEIAADSSLFGGRLRDAAAGPAAAAGFSDLFADASDTGIDGSDHYHAGLEYIFEGYLLHYGASRLLDPDGSDFQLLAGDDMYARGLTAIAALEDLELIEALSGLVRLCAFIHCEQHDPSLAMKAWAITTLRLAARASAPGSDAGDFSDLGKTVWSGGDRDAAAAATAEAGQDNSRPAAQLDAILEQLLAGHAPERRAALQERFSNIDANFRAEA